MSGAVRESENAAARVLVDCFEKVAMMPVLPLIATLQVPVPGQPLSDQPLNREPVSAAAVRVIGRLSSKDAVQTVPQVMPAGELVTVPLPSPLFVTARSNFGGGGGEEETVIVCVAVFEPAAFVAVRDTV